MIRPVERAPSKTDPVQFTRDSNWNRGEMRAMTHMTSAVTCHRAKSLPIAAMSDAVVQAFFDDKFAEPDSSRALYAVAAEVGVDTVVARLTQRSQRALCEMLATAANRRFADLAPISFVLSTSVVGPVQALLASGAPAEVVDRVWSQLTIMVSAYLGGAGVGVAVAYPRS